MSTPPTVLIVDDSRVFRTSVRRLLEADGFRVVGEAGDGTSGVQAILRLRPDVVLLDVVLPDMTGFEVCDVLGQECPGSTVILISTRDASTYRRRLRSSRARGFLPKASLSGASVSALLR